MKIKLAILAAIVFAAIGTTAIAGRDWTPPTPSPKAAAPTAAMEHGCCGMGNMKAMDASCPMGTTKPSEGGMSCHMGDHAAHTSSDAGAMLHKSCCK